MDDQATTFSFYCVGEDQIVILSTTVEIIMFSVFRQGNSSTPVKL